MKTLIQLVSEQTMQNLLPAMAIQPERIVHLCTPRMQSVSEALVRAVADHFGRNGQYRDIRWSVNAGSRGATGGGCKPYRRKVS